MAREHIIGRTGRVRELKSLLREKQVLYLSSFFCTGKTVLLNQLAQALDGPVLRFDMGADGWQTFVGRVKETPECTLLIDSLHLMDDPTAEALNGLIAGLGNGQRAVLAGRAQKLVQMQQLCITGVITILDKEYVLLDEEEIRELFLSYHVMLRQGDIKWLKQTGWGWPIVLHAVAQALAKNPERSLREVYSEASKGFWSLTVQKVIMPMPASERALLFDLSPFTSFTDEMARSVTLRPDAPQIVNDIAQKRYMLQKGRDGRYTFVPFVRDALFDELKRRNPEEYILRQYRRAALCCESQGDIPEAARLYILLRDTPKIKELLIRDTYTRPANGDYVALKPAYDILSEQDIASSPELMKGMCMIESLRGRVEQSERWYEALQRFIGNTPAADARRRTAQEAVAWLDIGLAHRGTKDTLKILVATAKLDAITDSAFWRSGFNVAGNSVSLINGGKDFSRWNTHGRDIYRLFKAPMERALGKGGTGIADIVLGECLLESSLDGDYTEVWRRVSDGLARLPDDPELQCAATGIQARIVMAQGNAASASDMLKNQLASLPENAARRLRQNLECAWLTFQLMQGHTGDALKWLAASAPDESGEFIILDRYRYMLKLRLYIITNDWAGTPLLVNRLANYFEQYQRPYMRIQLYLLEALIDRRTGRNTWREKMGAALRLARRYRLVRVIADEGFTALHMLCDMELPDDPWTQSLMKLTRAQAVSCPKYMKSIAKRPMLTDREYQVYSLLTAGLTNARIAKLLNITERAVKYHVTEIYQKLGVKSRSEALMKALELGDI